MSKPNDSRADGEKRQGRGRTALTVVAVLGAAGMLVQLLPSASAGIATGDGGRIAAPAPPAAATSQKAPGTHQLRCWQYGRLLFDEGPVTLSAEARQGARLVAIDRQGAALIVTEAGGTTCLARPFAAAPNGVPPR